jgi:hypothetical protein
VAKTEARYLSAIRTTADLVASGASATAVISLVRGQLTEMLTLRECRFQHGRLGGLPTFDSDGNVQWAGSMWDVERTGLSSDCHPNLSSFAPCATTAHSDDSFSRLSRGVDPANCPARSP